MTTKEVELKIVDNKTYVLTPRSYKLIAKALRITEEQARKKYKIYSYKNKGLANK